MTTTTAPRATQNEAFGFFGTCTAAGLDAERAWALAFEAITDATGAHDENAYGPDGVRRSSYKIILLVDLHCRSGREPAQLLSAPLRFVVYLRCGR